jgi:chromosomal replication initiation ATPase DnaA
MITIELITDVVCDHFGVDKNKVLSDNYTPGTRLTEYARIRHYSMYLCRYYNMGSFKYIGAYFKRDHPSVIHAIHRVTDEISVYPKRKELMQKFIEWLDSYDLPVELPEMSVYPDYING